MQMAEEFYRLRQKSTGLFLRGTRRIPPLNKDGSVSAAPPSLWGKRARIIPYFSEDVTPVTLDGLVIEIERIVRHSCVALEQDDLSLEVVVTVPTTNSKEKLAEIFDGISQDLLAEKIKGK